MAAGGWARRRRWPSRCCGWRWSPGGRTPPVALRRGHAAWCVAGGVLVAAAVTIVLLVTGHLEGPDVLGGPAVLAETFVMVAATAPITWWTVTHTRRTRVKSD